MSGRTSQLTAFISYANRYAPWVEHFHRDLERSLTALGAHDRVFFDRKELVSGQSWVDQLERGIAQADQLILILTPEALASEWVGKERSSFMALNRAQRLHVVRLVDCSLPAFLADLQYIDFADCDDAGYRDGLRRLLIGLLGNNSRADLGLAGDLVAPAPPRTSLPESLRKRIVACLQPLVEDFFKRRAIESALRRQDAALPGTLSRSALQGLFLIRACSRRWRSARSATVGYWRCAWRSVAGSAPRKSSGEHWGETLGFRPLSTRGKSRNGSELAPACGSPKIFSPKEIC